MALGSAAARFREWPHCGQNLAVDDTGLPQSAQTWPRGAAHCSQNFALAALSCWHFGHFIPGPGGSGEPDLIGRRG